MENSSLFQGPESSSLPNDYNQINSALLDVSQRIQHFLVSSNASKSLDNVYDVTDLNAKSALIAQDSLAKLNLPQILVLSEEAMGGATGAYSAARNTIYLTDSLLEPKQDNLLEAVLVEEMGHFFDTILNPGKDSPGDEGEFFQSVVMGNALSTSELQRIRSENDLGEVDFKGTRVQVEQNDSISTATDLGSLFGRRTISGSVSSSDINDYFRFRIDEPDGSRPGFGLDLTGLSADADVQLLSSSGSTITSSTRTGSSSESIRTNLGTGTYFVRVYRFSGSTSYNLALEANRGGTTVSNAASIGNLTGRSQSVSDYVGDTSTSDYYRFTLDLTSTFNLSLSGMSADGDVRLLNSSGSEITRSSRGGSSSESISRSLSSGTYYPHSAAP